jgi:hypothetical protein
VSQGIEDLGKINELPSNVGDTANWNSSCGKKDEGNPPLSHDRLWEIFEALKSPTHGVDERSKIACDPTFKVMLLFELFFIFLACSVTWLSLSANHFIFYFSGRYRQNFLPCKSSN